MEEEKKEAKEDGENDDKGEGDDYRSGRKGRLVMVLDLQ
jgi:hypothetical protein